MDKKHKISLLATTTYVFTMGRGSTLNLSRILQHYLSTILTSHHQQHPKPQNLTEPSNHYRMSSRHVKSFYNIRTDLLPRIVVTVATSHWLMSPLKAEADSNTVARKEGR